MTTRGSETVDDTGGAVTTLVVDDDADMRLLVRSVLRRGGIDVVGEAADGTEALAKFSQLHPPEPTVVLLDNQMPDLTGVEVASRIKRTSPDQLIVLFSAYLSESIIAEAGRLGVAACVSKTDALKLSQIIRDLIAN
ncbi:MAG TPA: response regulator [Jatrophihabitantaceae bacterium]|nr:response regulator [Jatrophihabitantaceae bacterium]